MFMKLRIVVLALVVFLTLSVGCSKPSSTGSDNSQSPDNSSASQQADDSSANGSGKASASSVVTVPAGKVLTVRLADQVGSKISQQGQSFGGSLARPVQINGATVIPAGAKISGEVVDAKPLGRFAGGALLQLKLDSIHVNGEEMPVQTATFTQTIKGKGKRTGVMVGGGAGLGALVGGLAGGGKGALIGAAAGAGAGTAGTALTGNKEIVLPAESAVAFTLKSPLKIRRTGT
jgi:hypothetical protein